MAGTTGCVFRASFNGNVMTVSAMNVLTGFLAKSTLVTAKFISGNTIEAVITDMADASSAEITFTIDPQNFQLSFRAGTGMNFIDSHCIMFWIHRIHLFFTIISHLLYAFTYDSIILSHIHVNAFVLLLMAPFFQFVELYVDRRTAMVINVTSVTSGTLRTLKEVGEGTIRTNGKIVMGQVIHVPGAMYTIVGKAGDIACNAVGYLTPGSDVLELTQVDGLFIDTPTNGLITVGLRVRCVDITDDMNVFIVGRVNGNSDRKFLLSETFGGSVTCVSNVGGCVVTFYYTGTGDTGTYGISVESTSEPIVSRSNIIAFTPSAVVAAAFEGNKMYVRWVYSGSVEMKMEVYRYYKNSVDSTYGEFRASVDGTCGSPSYLDQLGNSIQTTCYTLSDSVPIQLTFGIFFFTLTNIVLFSS